MSGKDDSASDKVCPPSIDSFQRQHDDFERFLKQFEVADRQHFSHHQRDIASSDNNTPFASFKRFVDDSFGAWAQPFINFPANLRKIHAEMQEASERYRQEELDISRRWTGRSDSPDHIGIELDRITANNKEDAHTTTISVLSDAYEKNQNVPPAKIKALFSDREFYPSRDYPWLGVAWFKRSAYSPIRLEAHPDLAASGTKWRNAFEDLLNASLDKPMDTRDNSGSVQTRSQRQPSSCGLDWLLSLQSRGILPPQLPNFWRLHGNDKDPLKFLTQNLPWDTEKVVLASERDRWQAFVASNTSNSPAALQADFAELMSAIATAYWSHSDNFSPEAVAERIIADNRDEVSADHSSMPTHSPTSSNSMYIDINSDGHKTPETEQDLYEQLDSSTHPRSLPLTGDLEEDVFRANGAIMDAYAACDTDSFQHILKSFEALHADLEPLLESVFAEWSEFAEFYEFLGEGLRRSGLSYNDEVGQRGEAPNQRCEAIQRFLTGTPEDASSAKKVDILSALTTTHTTRLADGTVTTRVVLKQRFADGREETTESVHTTHEPVQQQPETAVAEQPKKKGWFWS